MGQTPPDVTEASEGGVLDPREIQILSCCAHKRNETTNFKQQIRMKFKMEISSTGQNRSVLAVYALSDYVLLTRTVYLLLPVLFLTRWTTLLIVT